MATTEYQKRVCRYCKKEKFWIDSQKKLKDGTKIFVNQHHKRWAGRRCPECEKTRVKSTLQWDRFERNLIETTLLKAGYQLNSQTLPLKVVKDNQSYTVSIRHAAVEGDKILLESNHDQADLQILVFASVRICSNEQMQKIEPQALYVSRDQDLSSAVTHLS